MKNNKIRDRPVIHELLWSFFLVLLLPVELRGLLGAMVGMGQGRVLLPWLLNPEVAVEEGEKPPLTRAERRHSNSAFQKAGTTMTLYNQRQQQYLSTYMRQKKKLKGLQSWINTIGDDLTNMQKKRLPLWCLASSSAVTSDNLHLQWSCWLCGWLGLLHVLPWLACGGWQ